MNSKSNGELLLFILMELKLISSGWKVQKSSVNTVVSVSCSQWTLYRLYLLLISSRKEFREVEWNDLSKNGARVEELESCGAVILQSRDLSFTSPPSRRAAQRALLLSVLALSCWFFDKSSWLLEAPTHFLHPYFFCITDFPRKLPICSVLRVSPTEHWCTNDMMA